MTGLEIGGILAIAGAGANVFGQISGASAKADAEQKDANFKRAQADELLQRESINEGIMQDQERRSELSYGSTFSSTGREGAGIGGILEMRRQFSETLANSQRDAEFKAKMLRAGADVQTQLASDLVPASIIGGVGTLMGAGGQVYRDFRGPSKPQGLP